MADTAEHTSPANGDGETQRAQETDGTTRDSGETGRLSNSGVQPERRKLKLSPSASQLEKELEDSLDMSSSAEEGGKGDPFARVVEKKLRKIVREAFEGQKVRGVFKSWYLGARPAKVRHYTTPPQSIYNGFFLFFEKLTESVWSSFWSFPPLIQLIDDDDPDRTASDVMRDAITHLVRRKNKDAKPIKVCRPVPVSLSPLPCSLVLLPPHPPLPPLYSLTAFYLPLSLPLRQHTSVCPSISPSPAIALVTLPVDLRRLDGYGGCAGLARDGPRLWAHLRAAGGGAIPGREPQAAGLCLLPPQLAPRRGLHQRL